MPKGKRICACCEEPIRNHDKLYFGDVATHYENKPLCETCYYEDEPVATLYYQDEKEPYRISLTRNETEGRFKAKWHSTDAWRGRYELESENYSKIFSDAILSYHESEAMLKELNDKAVQRFCESGIDFYRAFLRTSNLFCTNYDIWVKNEPEQIFTAYLMLERIKAEVDYHNPIYSTGILFDRETLGKLQSILGDKYQIKTDADVMKLVQEKGESLLEEIKEHFKSVGESSG
jgi:hypothetical protein